MVSAAQYENARAQLDVLFLDKQDDYRWHGNTLVTQSELQISFLKDLVTLRNTANNGAFAPTNAGNCTELLSITGSPAAEIIAQPSSGNTSINAYNST